ncbi:MAG: substrate-binding domain-containing protein [Lachnospiraceae bacterium]|nr:substrate-binding domain-containing protein [Lachnospiraceae bacterium]
MKKTALTITIILICCVLMFAVVWSYFQNSLDALNLPDTSASETYDRHYALIPEQENTVLWQEIYESAKQEAAANNAWLELLEQDTGNSYTTADYLRILIAAKVDGIILKPDGTEEVRNLIDEAVSEGIPVVTVLEDDSDSQRISYVGLNSYQLADTYTEHALSLLNGESGTIMVLLDSESVNPIQSLAVSQMTRYLEEQKTEGQEVTVSLYYLDNSSDFDYEEGIRDLFVSDSPLPDILICMDEVLTECAYQALIDYNQVGSTSIIGFYYSDQILEAIDKGVIPVTLAVDTTEVGSFCIDALEEYYTLSHTSSYYSVTLSVITRANVEEYLLPVLEEEGL